MKKKLQIRSMLPYWISVVLVCAVFAVFFWRLYVWQIRDGSLYLEEANSSTTAKVSVDAARGEILDRDGNPLAYNTTAYKIVFRKPYMTDENANNTIHILTELLDRQKEEWTDEIPIRLNKNGKFVFRKNSEEAVEFLKSKNFLNLNTYADAQMCVSRLAELYEVDTEQYTDEELLHILSVRYNMTVKSFATTQPYTFADSVSKETMEIIEENALELPGVSIEVTTERNYENGSLVPHLLGSVGKLTEEEFDSLESKGYSYDDVVGKSGIESAFEKELRGENGVMTLTMNADGSVSESEITTSPVQGNTVYTTIDSDLQAVAQASLEQNVKKARSSSSGNYTGEDCVAGAAVVLNVKDFSVLAAATYPSYDIGKLQTDDDYYGELLEDSSNPMFNRALYGNFTPGSIFKPCVATAALSENVIDRSSTVKCEHVYSYYAPSYTPTCMGYHGSLNVVSALQYSCNVFFFDVGRRLGIEDMNLYSRAYGLGVATGIEIGESEGILASPQERAAAGGSWVPGDVIQAAIGQSDNSFTPLQLATYCATIANNGTRLKTHIVEKITDYSRENVISETEAQVAEEVPVSQENISIVQEGMRRVITSGTASGTFSDYGIAIAGKTGTAENPGHSDNVTFIGYAPYDDPEIAISVVLEYGSNSSCSMQVAKDIFDAYFYGWVPDENGNLVAPGIADAADSISAGAEDLN